MHGTAVKGILALPYAQKACTLFESLVSKAFHLLQFLSRVEGSLPIAVVHYLVGKRWTYSAHIAQ